MLYIRKLFTQDLRQGKQIAFPKEASYSFFSFDYLNKEADRRIKFTFRAKFNQFQEFDGKEITTRLYAAGSESRMDGDVKAFIRDDLHAQVGDLLLFKNKGTKFLEFDFMFVPKNNSSFYPLLSNVAGTDNHSICYYEEGLVDIPDNHKPIQQIFYGTPGSGKSHTIRERFEQDPTKVVRTTFHPDTDYATFVGCYKPITYEINDEIKIKYVFVPQAFTEAYVKAWNDPNSHYYLILEEINRGNCAQIFGDLFQLLDRKENGYSEYPINADADLRDYLLNTKDMNGIDVLQNKEGIKEGKLCLPPNLSIIASMNTSDQSLFPMDSAFKRRWAWEYVPIDYDNKVSGAFTITLGNKYYLWHDFLKIINERIKKVTSSEDKQMGNFFIKHSVDEKEFKDKVMFYLWSEVGKDNYQTNDALFHCYKPGTKDKIEFSFNELYASDNIQKLQDFMDILGEEAESKKYSWLVEEKEAATPNE